MASDRVIVTTPGRGTRRPATTQPVAVRLIPVPLPDADARWDALLDLLIEAGRRRKEREAS